MVPAEILLVDHLPLNPNGKLDRKALPTLETAAPSRDTAGTAPGTAHERLLCRLFAEALGLPAIGTDADFFKLGGHSLLGVRLAARIRDALGAEVSVGDLIQAPTVARLAALIDADEGRAALEPVLALRDGGGRFPLFCLHAATGLGWSYAALGPHLPDDQPLYAIQADGLSACTLPPADMAELARSCLAHIRAVQPSGPYHLVGWSFGGNLAHAVATALQHEREHVALLALLDSYPIDAQVLSADQSEPTLLGELLLGLGYQPEKLPQRPLDRSSFIRFVRAGKGPLAVLDEQVLAAVAEVFAINSRLLTEPVRGRFDGDLLFVTATRQRLGNGATHEAWRPHVSGAIHNVEVDAMHHDLMLPQPIAEIGAALTTHLPRQKGQRR